MFDSTSRLDTSVAFLHFASLRPLSLFLTPNLTLLYPLLSHYSGQSVQQAVAKQLKALKPPKTWTGRVFSDKMQKSCTVLVSRQVYEPRIGKYIRKQKKYIAHDEYNECRIGDIVEFKHIPKMSKRKSFQVVRIVLPAKRGTDPLLAVEAQQPTVVKERALQPQTLWPQDPAQSPSQQSVYSPYIIDAVKPLEQAVQAAAELNKTAAAAK